MIKVVLVVLAELVLISILTFLTLTLTHSHMRRSTIVGTICILFNIMIYVAPLAVMGNIYSNMEKKINGPILSCAILGYTYKLSCLDTLWAPFYLSRKYFGCDYKWKKKIKVVLVVLAELVFFSILTLLTFLTHSRNHCWDHLYTL
ncbi:hypothetical protein G4B88_026299 [Cannabis sativa]|uniref:Uncharacterized protein n=1 Tax=Cannabis sativa TaxID=3483 RepID=A0A7J6FUX1_CANSA|nr:hypothetical protein G4B88_026299 [Cannabis sativa]